MTVRAWFTISSVLLLALIAAGLAWFLRPARPPEILASVPEARLDGELVRSCWPQRGEMDCTSRPGPMDGQAVDIPASGQIRLVAAFPVQPEDGGVRIVAPRTGEEALAMDGWHELVAYQLDAGRWRLEAEARYPDGAFVRYAFPFTVRAG